MNVINVSSQIQYMCIEESCSYSFVQIIALNVIHYGNIHVHVTLKSVCNCASICTNDLSHSMYGRQVPASNGTNRAGKCSLTLDNCTPVTDNIQVDNLNKSIATGLIYRFTKCDALKIFITGDTCNSNLMGCRPTLYSRQLEHQNWFPITKKWCGKSIGNFERKVCMVAKIH